MDLLEKHALHSKMIKSTTVRQLYFSANVAVARGETTSAGATKGHVEVSVPPSKEEPFYHQVRRGELNITTPTTVHRSLRIVLEAELRVLAASSRRFWTIRLAPIGYQLMETA
jgi:hypothetical protein